MRQESGRHKDPAPKVVKDIRRATRKQYSAEEKIRIVLDGLRGEDSIGRAVPARGHQPEPLLSLVQGIPPGGQEAPGPSLPTSLRHQQPLEFL